MLTFTDRGISGGMGRCGETSSTALPDRLDRPTTLTGVTVIPLSDNGAMRLTTPRYYTPSGRSIQGLGIKPDVPVAETREVGPQFGPEREADLNHVLKSEGGTPDTGRKVRTHLPLIAKEIPSRPPKDFPEFDPSKPDDTDFQLQQALVVAKAMAAAQPQ